MHGTRRWSRALAGALTLWFGLVMAVPGALHSCPTIAAVSPQAPHGSHAGPGHQAPAPDDGAPIECRCVGSCALSGPIAVPVGGEFALVVAAPFTPQIPVLAPRAVRPGPADHFQPFANAPPLPLG